MKTYLFELIETSKWPFTDKRENPSEFGIILDYRISRLLYCTFFGKKLLIYKKVLGRKCFYRPLKKDWDKQLYRVPYVYWGKKGQKLTRLWVILKSITVKDNTVLVITEESLINHKVTLFGETFISHDITKHLFKREKKFTITNINN